MDRWLEVQAFSAVCMWDEWRSAISKAPWPTKEYQAIAYIEYLNRDQVADKAIEVMEKLGGLIAPERKSILKAETMLLLGLHKDLVRELEPLENSPQATLLLLGSALLANDERDIARFTWRLNRVPVVYHMRNRLMAQIAFRKKNVLIALRVRRSKAQSQAAYGCCARLGDALVERSKWTPTPYKPKPDRML